MASVVLCDTCGNVGLEKGADGFHYCGACGTQSQQFIEEDLGDFQGTLGQDASGRRTFNYARQHNVERQEQEDQLRKLNAMLRDGDGGDDLDDPDAAKAREEALLRAISQKDGEDQTLERMRDLASQFEDLENVHVWSGSQRMYDPAELPDRLANHVREVYVQGLQRMIQLQCQALVERFGVSAVICGIVEPIWLRFVAYSRVFEQEWASEAVLLADSRRIKDKGLKVVKKKPDPASKEKVGSSKRKKTNSMTNETNETKEKKEKLAKVPVTETGLKMSRVWVESIKSRLPLRITLGIVYLACYVAREPVLATDIASWAADGTLPFLTAFLEFQPKRFIGPDLKVIPVSELDPRTLFRPSFLSNAGMIELLSGHIANRLGFELPPVNFQAVSIRLLESLGIDRDEVMVYLERLYEWYTPNGLWLSARHRAFPVSAYTTAMVIVVVKLLYDVDGRTVSGLYWTALMQLSGRRTAAAGRSNFQGLLETIEQKLMTDAVKPELDLKEYLRYCQEKVFASAKIPADEELMYDHMWDCFDKQSQEVVSGRDRVHTAGVDADRDRDRKQEQAVGDTAVRNSGSESDDEVTLGSGAWSRAPSVRKDESQNDNLAVAQEQDQDQDQEQDQDEATSENKRIDQAKNRLLNSIARELQVCGFKIVPGSLSSKSATSRSSSSGLYPMFQLRSHARKSSKYVYGDYFMLLYACSRFTKIKCNVIHKCVQYIETDLYKMERRIDQFIQQEMATTTTTSSD